jgi:CheY-like chemotaxis protein
VLRTVAADLAQVATAPLRIMVVDDDPAMVGAITALVGTEGHQVVTAYDGLTAVRRFREERPDLVLLDLAMPGPDGFHVAGQIRAEGSAPIIVISGESSESAKVRALGIGADDYLVKPFGRAELLARIAAVMRRARRSDSPDTARPNGISAPRVARSGRRRSRAPPSPGAGRLAGRARSRSAVAEAAPRSTPGQARCRRRTGGRGDSRRWLPPGGAAPLTARGGAPLTAHATIATAAAVAGRWAGFG